MFKTAHLRVLPRLDSKPQSLDRDLGPEFTKQMVSRTIIKTIMFVSRKQALLVMVVPAQVFIAFASDALKNTRRAGDVCTQKDYRGINQFTSQR